MKRHAILTDVTTYISAQEYTMSKCMGRSSADPFGLQAFAELMQSIFLYDHVYVPHPVKLRDCSKEDFGKEPRLLIDLLDRGIVEPLNLSSSVSSRVKEDEENILSFLKNEGAKQLMSYLTTTEKDEQLRRQERRSFEGVTLSRLREWSQYQYAEIRYAEGHHPERIPTRDGIEKDPIGKFARSFADVFPKLGKKHTDYFVATLLRGLRYQIRANIAEIHYQPHVMRRDFILACGFHDSGVSKDYTREMIKLIRGVRETIAAHAEETVRVELLDYEVPLIGGKLWEKGDTDRYANSPDSFIDFVVDRVDRYRDETRILRDAISAVRNEEGTKRLERDFERIQERLLDAFGLKRPILTEIDKALVEGGLAASSSVPGLPNMKGLLIEVIPFMKRKVFSRTTPLQQFVYREFLRGWKATK